MKPHQGSLIKLGLFILIIVTLAIPFGCRQKKSPLTVYVGKGLKSAMEEIAQSFETKHNTPLSIIYAGSNTLLTTIQKSRKGDVFIPGSKLYLLKLGEQVTSSQQVAFHIPSFIVRADNSKSLQSFDDLMKKGVRIAVGNKDMCAIGKVAETIIAASEEQELFRRNIVVTCSTVNELLDLVINREVDAALAWEDMEKWQGTEGLQLVSIPESINVPKEIWVAVLSYSENPKQASLFADFVATEGKQIFQRHGFRVQ